MLRVESLPFMRLPLTIISRWTKQLYLVVFLAADEQIGIHIAGINDMKRWQEIFLFEVLMDTSSCGIIGDRSRSRLDMGNQMRGLLIAGFREMHLVAHPGSAAFFAGP
jgi:hypothetical protein